MLRVFISHTWSETAVYERVVEILNFELGAKAWEDLSIPQSRRLELIRQNLSEEEEHQATIATELNRLKALLADPNLPDVSYRAVYRNGVLEEIPTYGSVLKKIRQLRGALDDHRFKVANFGEGEPRVDVKGSYRAMQMFPELASAIEHRIASADVVLALITPLVGFREWVEFEIASCAKLGIPVVCVQAGEHVSANFRLECQKIIPLQPGELVLAIGGYGAW